MSTNPLVSRLCKGIYNARPPKPRYMDTWPVEQLLDHLRRLAPSTALSLLQLSRKLATLMLLLLGQRTQGLHLLDIRNIKVQSSMLTITYGDHLKQSRPGTRLRATLLRHIHQTRSYVLSHCTNSISRVLLHSDSLSSYSLAPDYHMLRPPRTLCHIG